jgi:hypothetical protein
MFDYCNDDWWTSQHEDPSWEHIFLCQALDSYPDQTGNLQLGIRVLQEVKGTMQNHLERKPFVVVRYGDEMGWDGSIQNLPQIELMNMPKCQPFWQLAKKLWMWTAGLWFWLISIYIYIYPYHDHQSSQQCTSEQMLCTSEQMLHLADFT